MKEDALLGSEKLVTLVFQHRTHDPLIPYLIVKTDTYNISQHTIEKLFPVT